MDRISIQDLKGQLSAAVAKAERGSTVVITRHNRPVARLTPASVAQVHLGKRHGRAKLVPALSANTNGRYLDVLMEDRKDGSGR
ncbi:MAG: type II toxin-antitoxin system Phd/YefM family antitoxin [Acidobacteria bacterium]|nr:type II toxin-antitoxin system Phd/YefM family antitoxin [Acidobacteriota bacterium]